MIIPIRFAMNSVFLIKGDNGNILIDAGMKGQNDRIMKVLSENGAEKIDLIIITHAHIDHFGNIDELNCKLKAPVLIHENDLEWLKKGENAPSKPYGFKGKTMLKMFGGMQKRIPNGYVADIIMKGYTFNLESYGVNARIIHTPGHTAGSVSVISDEGYAVIGDLLMSFVVKKNPGYPIYVYDVDIWKNSLKKVLDTDVEIMYPSHGEVYSRENVKKKFFK